MEGGLFHLRNSAGYELIITSNTKSIRVIDLGGPGKICDNNLKMYRVCILF